MLRKCQYSQHHVEDHDPAHTKHIAEAWVWVVGYFHGWAGLSERPRAIIEDLGGKIHFVDYEGVEFLNAPD